MALFTGTGLGQKTPTPLTAGQMFAGAAQGIGKSVIDPLMESKGFISEENQVIEIMKEVDISSVDSVSEAFNKIMVISPEAAAEFKAQVLPLVTAKQNELASKSKVTTKDVQIETVGYSFNGVTDPDRTMKVKIVNGKPVPIIDPSTQLPYSESRFQGDTFTGTIPQGYEIYFDNSGNRQMRVIPGSPEEAVVKEKAAMKVMSQAALTQKSETVLNVAGDIRNTIKASNLDLDSEAFGIIGVAQSKIPGTKSADISASIETLNARIGFDELAAMRKESPTGGALGQVSELELKQLNAALGSLSRSQSEAQFLRNLTRVEEQYTAILQTIAETGDGTYIPKLGDVTEANPGGI